MDKIKIIKKDFDVSKEIDIIRKLNNKVGAIVSFVGTVRDIENNKLESMYLEHYPKMTEKLLADIIIMAKKRWDIFSATIIHRVGKLKISEKIVLVIVTSKHRQEAFDACNFIIDYLKTDAPFWKKEKTNNSNNWVETRESDFLKKRKWKN